MKREMEEQKFFKMYIVTTEDERASLIPDKKLAQIRSVLGEDNVNLIIAETHNDLSLNMIEPDAFVLCETKDYEIVSKLQSLRIASTAEDIQTIKLDEDKVLLKKILNLINVKSPRLFSVDEVVDDKEYFVKPLILEDSIGIDDNSFCSSKRAVFNKVNEIKSKYNKQSIIEEYIEGKDVTVGIMKNKNGEYIIEAIEIDGGSDFLTYVAKTRDEEKYKALQNEKIKEAALKTFEAIDAKYYARIDMRLDKETKEPYVLEVNLYPGLGAHGYMFRCFEFNLGWTYEEFINKIVETYGRR